MTDAEVKKYEHKKWIFYDKQKPEKYQNCIVVWKDGSVKAWQYYPHVFSIWDENVKYWQPMPENTVWKAADEYNSETINNILKNR